MNASMCAYGNGIGVSTMRAHALYESSRPCMFDVVACTNSRSKMRCTARRWMLQPRSFATIITRVAGFSLRIHKISRGVSMSISRGRVGSRIHVSSSNGTCATADVGRKPWRLSRSDWRSRP